MELGSQQHKQLLMRGIVKVSIKIATMGLLLGVILMVPMLIRENTFSTGLFYLGVLVALGSSLYALLLGFKKYQRLIRPFANNPDAE